LINPQLKPEEKRFFQAAAQPACRVNFGDAFAALAPKEIGPRANWDLFRRSLPVLSRTAFPRRSCWITEACEHSNLDARLPVVFLDELLGNGRLRPVTRS
jgi:hypothetical protein